MSALAESVRPREVWAWAMYDFANSSYTTVVITAIFNAYFVGVAAEKAAWGTFAWTLALSISYALVMATAPLVGAWADKHAAKKRLLVFSTIGCVTATAALALVGRGDVALAMGLLIISNFCFATGENVVAAFLPELADSNAMGKVSSWGWGIGYLGGLLCLGLCLAYVNFATARGDAASDYVPMTMLITAGMFALASLPTFIWLRERAQPQPHRHLDPREVLRQLAASTRVLRDYPDLARFLVCTVFYQAGTAAVITLAGIYAQQALGFTVKETITLILVVNITAAFGALAFGVVQDRLGHIPTLALTLVAWSVMVLLAWAATGPHMFWAAAFLAGVCMGSSQSGGRALVGYLSPTARVAEFFGLWGVAVKFSAILGPLTYGVITWFTGNDHRTAILITGVYFLIGLTLLFRVDSRRGRALVVG